MAELTTRDEEILQWSSRVISLERKVDSLESELRLIRRKVRAMDMSRYGYDMISETVIRVLNDSSWNISKNKSRTEKYSSDDDGKMKVEQKPCCCRPFFVIVFIYLHLLVIEHSTRTIYFSRTN